MESGLKKELILISPLVDNYVIRFTLLFAFGRTIPISLHILSALTPPGYKIRIFDQRLLWLKKDFLKGVLVGISCLTSGKSILFTATTWGLSARAG